MEQYFRALTLFLPSRCASFAPFVTKDSSLLFCQMTGFVFNLFGCCGVIDAPEVDQSQRGHLGRFTSRMGLFLKNSCKHLYIKEIKKKKKITLGLGEKNLSI